MTTIPERINELRGLMAAFTVRPIDPSDPTLGHLYFPFHTQPGQPRGSDPIAKLANTVDLLATASTTCQLFSGFQGTGKSTELRRLSARLESRGFQVIFVEGSRYINLYQPLEVTDLLVSVAAGVAEAVWAKLGVNPLRETVLTHITNFLMRLDITNVQVGVGAAFDVMGANAKVDLGKVQAGLTENPSFKAKVQDALRNKLTTVLDAFRDYMREVRELLKGDSALSPALIIDDLEKVVGLGDQQAIVARQVEQIFSVFHYALRIEGWHTIWASPPYLRFMNRNIALSYDHYAVLPMVRVWTWMGVDPAKTRGVDPVGLSALKNCLELRGNIKGLFASPELIDKLIIASSGHLRDLFRLMQDVLRAVLNQEDPRGGLDLPAVETIVSDYVSTCQMAVYTEDHALLREISVTQRVSAENEAQVQRISKLMDTQLVMIYRNGVEWFDVSTPVQLLLAEAPPAGAS